MLQIQTKLPDVNLGCEQPKNKVMHDFQINCGNKKVDREISYLLLLYTGTKDEICQSEIWNKKCSDLKVKFDSEWNKAKCDVDKSQVEIFLLQMIKGISKLDYRVCFVEIVNSEYLKFSIIATDYDLYLTRYFNPKAYEMEDDEVIFTYLRDGVHILSNIIEIKNITSEFVNLLKNYEQ